MRVAISVEERVAVTLKHLAHGDNYNALSQVFRISRPAIAEIVPEVCAALYTTLAPEYLRVSILQVFLLLFLFIEYSSSEHDAKWKKKNDKKYIRCQMRTNLWTAGSFRGAANTLEGWLGLV